MRLVECSQSVGHIELRLGDDVELVRYSGQLGYSVVPAYRGRHLAARSLKLLVPLVRRHQSLAVRTAAAIASARECADPTVERLLKEALEHLDQLKVHPILFNEGDWRGWICMSLSAFGEEDNLEQLLTALSACNAFEALEVTAADAQTAGVIRPRGRGEAPQVGDVVIYGNYDHSGVITGMKGKTPVVTSDWGDWGVYEHEINDIHPAYKNMKWLYYECKGGTK